MKWSISIITVLQGAHDVKNSTVLVYNRINKSGSTSMTSRISNERNNCHLIQIEAKIASIDGSNFLHCLPCCCFSCYCHGCHFSFVLLLASLSSFLLKCLCLSVIFAINVWSGLFTSCFKLISGLFLSLSKMNRFLLLTGIGPTVSRDDALTWIQVVFATHLDYHKDHH